MDLLISAAGDVTADLLCKWAGQRVLRVNLERWWEYDLRIGHSHFRIGDHHGREVTDSSLGNVIWRKPLDDVDPELGNRWFAFHEFRYAMRSIVSQRLLAEPRSVPVNPFALSQIDKFRQLRLAKQFFPVPAWELSTNPSGHLDKDSIVKGISGLPIPGTGTPPLFLFAAQVEVSSLEPGWPWFIQDRVTATFDVTVVHVDGTNFAYSLRRDLFDGDDWRPHIGSSETTDAWQRHHLSPEQDAAIISLMQELGLRYGRLDFLLDAEDPETLWFLEVNPNGQWAWLDPDQQNGLFYAMTRFLFSPASVD